jgi:hypothetical protein
MWVDDQRLKVDLPLWKDWRDHIDLHFRIEKEQLWKYVVDGLEGRH